MNRIISGRAARRLLPAAAAVLIGAGLVVGQLAPAAVAAPVASAAGAVAPSTTGGEFGPNVYIFTPSMSQASIQGTLDSIANQQVSNQFGSQRYAILFEPGTYGSKADPLIFQVGYYTTVAGLGLNPNDVTINGLINVANQCSGRQLHRARQLLALAIEPHDQRDDRDWLRGKQRTLGGLAGCTAATSPHKRRQPVPVRLLQPAGLLQRRLHRRLPVHRYR